MQKIKLFSIRCLLYAISCLLCAMVSQVGFADSVYMNDESVIKGLVVEEHHDRIIFSTLEGEKTIFRKDIDEIFFDELEQNYYYIANRFLNESDFESAKKFYIKTLEVNKDYNLARYGLLRLEDKREKDIKKWRAANPLSILKYQVGISIEKEDDFCRVKKVFEKNIGLNLGDAISSVWDESTKFMEEIEVAKRIIGIPERPVKIVIERELKLSLIYVPWYLKIIGRHREEILPLRMEFEGLTVGLLTRNSLAAKAGLKKGDRIIAIDGKSTRYMPLKEADVLIHTKPLKEVKLTIERGLKVTRKK